MTEIPEWVAALVGRLMLENELLRRALAETLPAPDPAANGHVPEPELVQ